MSLVAPKQTRNGEMLRTKNYILYSLGHPKVSVPVVEEHLNFAIDEAISWWYKYSTAAFQYIDLDYWIFQTTAGQNLYELDKCIDPGKIKTVIYNPQNYSLFNIAFNQNFDFLFFTTQEQIPELTTFYFALMKQEFVNMVLGQEGTYEIIGSPPKLHLMPAPEAELDVAVLFSKLPDDQTLDKIVWIWRYALASTKVMLGEILSRYSTIPGAMGDIQLNGTELKSEGNQEKKDLIEELKQNTDVYHIHTDFQGY